MALLISGQVDQLQHALHAALDFILGHLFELEAEGNIVKHVQVREQGILLENRVHAALVGRNIKDILALKEELAARGRLETSNDAQRGGFSASGGPEKSNEFFLADIQVDVIQDGDTVIILADMLEVDKVFLLDHL